jgi:aryl-alcohol dehydrogenase-like predicted oxidoreductase
MRALDDQVRLGKVLYVGVSNWPAWEVARATTLAELRDWSPFVGLQVEYSLLERTPERDLLPMADGLGLGVTAWSPLAGGQLTGKYLDPAGNGRITALGDAAPPSREGTDGIVRATVAVADELGVAPSQVALAWLLARPMPAMPILGITKQAQLAENLAAADVVLAPQQIARLDAASAIDLGYPHDFLARDAVGQFLYGEVRDRIDA